MREEGEQAQRRRAAAMAMHPSQLAALDHPPVTIELMDWQRWQILGNAMQKERAEYFAQMRRAD